VIYDAKGAAWVYTNPQALTFVRQSITVDYAEGDVVVVRDGPPAGMSVVTEGASQLTGIEFGVGK
jgi:multidrug efflux pump subunit AcrA (membrane-fusion protein)